MYLMISYILNRFNPAGRNALIRDDGLEALRFPTFKRIIPDVDNTVDNRVYSVFDLGMISFTGAISHHCLAQVRVVAFCRLSQTVVRLKRPRLSNPSSFVLCLL